MKYLITLFLLLSSVAYAEKPITLVVAFAPGGSADTSARILAKGLSNTLNTAVVVENKLGAGGEIAHKYVAEAKPNGNTILLSSVGPLTVSYFKGVEPVSMVVQFPHVFVVPASLGVTTLKEFVALGKTKQLTYASTGVDSVSHAQGQVLSDRAGLNMLHVPYKGGSLAIVDVIAGRVDGFFAGLTVVDQHIKTGKLVALAVSGGTRSEFIPNVPTIAEQGFPGFDMPNAYVVVAPANTPKSTLNALNNAINKTLKDKEVVESLQAHGFSPMLMDRVSTKRYIDKSLVTYSVRINQAKDTQ